MSVLDVLVHKMRARAAKIRLDKLKESENDAVMSVYECVFRFEWECLSLNECA